MALRKQEVRCADSVWRIARAVGAAGPCKYEVHEDDLQFEPLQKEWEASSERDKARCAPRG